MTNDWYKGVLVPLSLSLSLYYCFEWRTIDYNKSGMVKRRGNDYE